MSNCKMLTDVSCLCVSVKMLMELIVLSGIQNMTSDYKPKVNFTRD